MRKLFHRTALATQAMLLCMACVAWGQVDTARVPLAMGIPFIGGGGSVGIGTIISDLVLPGFTPECGTLMHGSDLTWSLWGLVEFPLTSGLSLQLRPGLSIASGYLREQIPTPLPIAKNDGTTVPGRVDQELLFDRLDIGITPLLRAQLTDRLHIMAGISFARTLNFRQTHRQVAVSPEDLLLANNRRDLVLNEGDLLRPQGVMIGVDGGFSYDMPIGSTSTLSPELFVSLPITSQTPDGAWRSLALRAGLSVRIGILPRAIPPRADPHPPILIANIETYPRVVGVKIDEYDSVEVLPLLNRIFFAEGSARIPSRYQLLDQQNARHFGRQNLVGSALDVYYHILNIIGQRMRESVGATIEINGYHNGRERDARLAMQRAEAVRRYLVDVWGIPAQRIRVHSGGLPPNPSTENTQEGFEENARVEIVASDPNITKPWVRIHRLRVASPPVITFYPRITTESGIAEWRLKISDRDIRSWKVFSGYGAPPDSITWGWRSDSGALPSIPVQLSYGFSVVDSSGQGRSTVMHAMDIEYQQTSQIVEKRVGDTLIENYSLLLFNFDSPEVTPLDRELLEAIAAGVGHGATVTFIGYTDSLGAELHNRELATQRATETARIFQSLVAPDVSIVIDTNGGERERFPYNTPEGRSHSRTVFIQIRTPAVPEGG